MAWHMTTCLDSFDQGSPTVEGTFETPDEWRAWLRMNYADIIERPQEGFILDTETRKQYGTNNRYSHITREEA